MGSPQGTPIRRFQLSVAAALLLGGLSAAPVVVPPSISPADARVIAKEAYVYGFPLVDNYRIQYAYFVDHGSPEFKAPWNEIHNESDVYTPKDQTMVTAAPDVLYSQLGADLRAEPLVLSMPAVETGRYYSVEFFDLCTFNIGYAGTRVSGNAAGNFLLAGPGWTGAVPPGVRGVIRSDTDLAFVLYRTQLSGSADLDKVKAIQAGFKVQPLSKFLGTKPPAAPPTLDFMQPVDSEQERTSLEFFSVLNFILRLCPPDPSEAEMMTRFARLDIGPGKAFDTEKFPPAVRQAIEGGIADAWRAYDGMERQVAKGEITTAALFGTRTYLKDMRLFRMAGAVDGMYGNTIDEAYYPCYFTDAKGDKVDASAHNYSLHFAAGALPPVNGFWSLTMYEMPARTLVANPMDRYLVDARMLPKMKHDADGGVTIYIQRDSPGKDKESNWLPAPDGPFLLALNMYWPKPEVISGKWMKPPLKRVN
jgi:hypothetical protein